MIKKSFDSQRSYRILKFRHLFLISLCGAWIVWCIWLTAFPAKLNRPRIGIWEVNRGSIEKDYFKPRIAKSTPLFGPLESDPGWKNADAMFRTHNEMTFNPVAPQFEEEAVNSVREAVEGEYLISLANGETVKFVGMVTNYATGTKSTDAVIHRFGPNGEPNDGIVPELNWPDWPNRDAGQFSVTFLLDVPEDVSLHEASLLRPETGEGMRILYMHQVGRLVAFEFCSYAWTDAPLDLVFGIEYGPQGKATIPFEIGARAVLPDFDIGVLAIDAGFWKFGEIKFEKPFTVRLQDNEEGTLLRLRMGSTHVWHPACKIEFLGIDGAAIDPAFTGPKDRYGISTRFFQFSQPESSIASIRIRTHRPMRDRLIFRLPRLPGVPKANQGLENLFDTRIPYLRLENDDQFLSVLSGGTHLSSAYPHDVRHIMRPFTRLTYPLEFENVTLHELLAKWNRNTHYRPLLVNLKHFSFREKQSGKLAEIWNGIQEWFRSNMNIFRL